LAFTLKANGFQNTYMATLFEGFGVKSLFGGGKFVYNIYGNPNSSNRCLPCPLKDSLSKVFSIQRPLLEAPLKAYNKSHSRDPKWVNK
jgi:hypothetical protein